MSRLLIIGFIWLGCSAAWAILGSSLTIRSADTSSSRGEEVHGLWGSPLYQRPPRATYTTETLREESKTVQREGEAPVTTTTKRRVLTEVDVPLERSALAADFELEHRKRGLLWFATYGLSFRGTYTFRNSSNERREVAIQLPLDISSRTYDGLRVADDRGREIEVEILDGMARWTQRFAPSEAHRFDIAFRTRGTESWTYVAAPGGEQVRDFRLRVTTDFPEVDFPLDSVSPSSHSADRDRWNGEWRFDSLITSSAMGIRMPEKMNPGPLAARITFFAPVSLLFFFFVLSMLALTSGRELHPMHYFLLGCAFFAFHLLFAYSVDHIPLIGSFVLAAIVSMLLVLTYVRHFVGWRFALTRVAPVQLVYLVLFSASFFWKGFTGLAITIGAILTLFAVMQLTGRLDWTEAFASRKRSALT